MTQASESSPIELSPKIVRQSDSFVGQWNRLISTTNWEKGAIIVEWRSSLKKSKASVTESSDEAWSQLVGGVTPQHVGRLRRTYERFGHVQKEYEGIFWSHFYAALEWDDAEMWLEGAVQSKWSVSKMRRQRWEVLGKLADQEPNDADIVISEVQEENQSLELSEGKRRNDRDYIEGPVFEGPDFGESDAMLGPKSSTKPTSNSDKEDHLNKIQSTATSVRPFESFVDLPDDVEEATNAFKVAIIRHRSMDWCEISEADMLGLLDALKLLVGSS
jgi:hypothetical protein